MLHFPSKDSSKGNGLSPIEDEMEETLERDGFGVSEEETYTTDPRILTYVVVAPTLSPLEKSKEDAQQRSHGTANATVEDILMGGIDGLSSAVLFQLLESWIEEGRCQLQFPPEEDQTLQPTGALMDQYGYRYIGKDKDLDILPTQALSMPVPSSKKQHLNPFYRNLQKSHTVR